MNNLHKLHELAYNHNHRITNYNLSTLKSKAAIIEIDGNYGIFIDRKQIETKAEETAITAHELGHAETGSTHKLNSNYDVIEKHEYRANVWATHYLIPFNEYLEAINKGNTKLWQLAEYFDVTEDFISIVHQVYCNEGKFLN